MLLTRAATGNELVEKGLIHVVPEVAKKFSIPRLRTGKMLQKRKEMPTDSDSKGNFDYDERELVPVDFMAFTTFNPRTFEQIWRPWQPKGNLVFAELPAEGQNALLREVAKSVKFELGFHFVNGVYGEDDDHLFNGIVTRMLADRDVVRVSSKETTMIKKLKAVKDAIPVTLRSNPGLRILMSIADFDAYDEELTQQPNKGANYTDMNVDVIQIDKLTNAGEKYFFKMLMKADTNIAWGEDVILLDGRVAAKASVSGTTITMKTPVETVEVTPSENSTYSVTGDGVIIGASLTLANKSVDKKATIDGIDVKGGETASLGYDGKKWFKS